MILKSFSLFGAKKHIQIVCFFGDTLELNEITLGFMGCWDGYSAYFLIHGMVEF